MMNHRKKIEKQLLSSENRKLYNLLQSEKNKTKVNSIKKINFFDKVNSFSKLEPNDNSSETMTKIAKDIQQITSSNSRKNSPYSTLTSSQLASSPLASSPLASSPLSSSQLASSPLASSPLASSPLASSPLASLQFASSPSMPILSTDPINKNSFSNSRRSSLVSSPSNSSYASASPSGFVRVLGSPRKHTSFIQTNYDEITEKEEQEACEISRTKESTCKNFVKIDLAPDNIKETSMKSVSPCMIEHPSIIDGGLIEKFMKNKVNTYFDKIYVFNMDKRIDRWLNTKKILESFQIFNYKRFSGVDGSLYKNDFDIYRKKCYNKGIKNEIRSVGAWGILSGMKNLLQDAIANKYERILVLQDDIILHNKFNELFNKNINNIPNNWLLLYLGCSQYSLETINYYNTGNTQRKKYYFPNGKTCGAFSVGIHSAIYETIIKLINSRFGPFDQGCLGTIQKNFNKNCFVMQPYLVIADLKESDCRAGRDQILFSKRFGWNLSNFSYKKPYINNIVSVVFVVKDSALTVEKCLNKLISQDILFSESNKHLEIIIIDNNSQDATVEIIKKFMKKIALDKKKSDDPEIFNKIKISLYQTPVTFSKKICYNLGLGLSNGFFITFQEDYFISHSKRLSQQLLTINEFSADFCISGNNETFYPETLFFNRLILNQTGYIETTLDNYLHKILFKFRHCKNDSLIELLYNQAHAPIKYSKNINLKKYDYTAFIKEYDNEINPDNLSQLTNIVYQPPLTLENV